MSYRFFGQLWENQTKSPTLGALIFGSNQLPTQIGTFPHLPEIEAQIGETSNQRQIFDGLNRKNTQASVVEYFVLSYYYFDPRRRVSILYYRRPCLGHQASLDREAASPLFWDSRGSPLFSQLAPTLTVAVHDYILEQKERHLSPTAILGGDTKK